MISQFIESYVDTMLLSIRYVVALFIFLNHKSSHPEHSQGGSLASSSDEPELTPLGKEH